MPKPQVSAAGQRHNPLQDDLLATGPLRQKPSKQNSRKAARETEDNFVDSKSSQRILAIGRELAEEDEEESVIATKPNSAFDFTSRPDEEELPEETYDDEEGWGDEEETVEEVEVDPADLATWNKFFPPEDDPQDLLIKHGWSGQAQAADDQGGTNLADLILAKIAEREAAESGQFVNAGAIGVGDTAMEEDYEPPPKVIEVYTKCGIFLSRYKSGKLPKVFKILPTVPHWEDILGITRPDKWTPNACYEATKIFVSGKPLVAQRFLEMVILERVREDIYETKKLNVHFFKALKKGLYKPAAFFKGFLFPLASSGTCTIREARIISAVLVRVSIPILHSAAALKGLCDIAAQEASAGTEGGGATNIFIRALLEKKYALPVKVIDALIFHFLRFRSVDPASVGMDDVDNAMSGVTGPGSKNPQLPVIWHQSLLAFAQRYRNEITEDQREALLDLLLTHGHSAIGPEVRRELLEGRGRGVVVEPDMLNNGDDTMDGPLW